MSHIKHQSLVGGVREVLGSKGVWRVREGNGGMGKEWGELERITSNYFFNRRSDTGHLMAHSI